jgi:hypothetical protein
VYQEEEKRLKRPLHYVAEMNCSIRVREIVAELTVWAMRANDNTYYL